MQQQQVLRLRLKASIIQPSPYKLTKRVLSVMAGPAQLAAKEAMVVPFTVAVLAEMAVLVVMLLMMAAVESVARVARVARVAQAASGPAAAPVVWGRLGDALNPVLMVRPE